MAREITAKRKYLKALANANKTALDLESAKKDLDKAQAAHDAALAVASAAKAEFEAEKPKPAV